MTTSEPFSLDNDDLEQLTQISPTDEVSDGDDLPRDDDDSVLEEGRRLLEEAEAKLSAVERALARLDAGTYGLCEVCNAPIAPLLLSERPSRRGCELHEVAAEGAR